MITEVWGYWFTSKEFFSQYNKWRPVTDNSVTYFSLLFHYLGLASDRPNIDPNMHAFNSFFFWSV